MGMSHNSRPVFGVQFHPESIATEHGHAIVGNFLAEAGLR
jgi:anthranilate synthase component 2